MSYRLGPNKLTDKSAFVENSVYVDMMHLFVYSCLMPLPFFCWIIDIFCLEVKGKIN